MIQIAKVRGLQTLNFVCDLPDIAQLKEKLQALGTMHVLTYNELADKSIHEQIKGWTGGKVHCVTYGTLLCLFVAVHGLLLTTTTSELRPWKIRPKYMINSKDNHAQDWISLSA